MFIDNKHQIQYLYPLNTSVPQVVVQAHFTANNLTNMTDKICIDLFSQVLPESSETSTVAAVTPAAEETNE